LHYLWIFHEKYLTFSKKEDKRGQFSQILGKKRTIEIKRTKEAKEDKLVCLKKPTFHFLSLFSIQKYSNVCKRGLSGTHNKTVDFNSPQTHNKISFIGPLWM
jgi:hypothetical protein